MLRIIRHDERNIEEDLLAFHPRHPMFDPVLLPISFVPFKAAALG
jgi:hypothetical protein